MSEIKYNYYYYYYINDYKNPKIVYKIFYVILKNVNQQRNNYMLMTIIYNNYIEIY